MRYSICLILFSLLISGQVFSDTTEIVYLSGKDKDSAVPWDFFCTSGMNSGQWTTIDVPSNWELQGFGAYNYGHDNDKANEQGKYKTTFHAPESWKAKKVRIVFQGVMTDTKVFINGKSAGPVHQGGFYEFKYDITDLILPGQNVLEVTVSKVSSSDSVEKAERKADYWVFGGIYRGVYLEVNPQEYIDWTSIDARADGKFSVAVYTNKLQNANKLKGQIVDSEDNPVGSVFVAEIMGHEILLQTKVENIKQWTAETPELYKVRLELCEGDQIIHRCTERFGFRTFEVRESDGLYLNGRKIVLKGVNRHSFRPDSGRCLSRQECYDDARLIKAMNMNAVRMSHYPPDKMFLEACDELGLYVLDELAGWQKPSYATEVGKKLVAEMLKRDVNHPSILFWDNANEGGWNHDLDEEFAKYDLQKRKVLHPWDYHDGVDTDHYESYDSTVKKLAADRLFMPTEFLHGLYDGGHGAGLEDYWTATRASKMGVGGFLWVMADEGVIRTDKEGIIDTHGSRAPDGIVGPYHEKEGSYYTIKEIWSPVQIGEQQFDEEFDGTIEVKNEYHFTNLNQLKFKWQLVNFDKQGQNVQYAGDATVVSIQPRQKGSLKVDLPDNWKDCDVFYLDAYDVDGRHIWKWSRMNKDRNAVLAESVDSGEPLRFTVKNEIISVSGYAFQYDFDKDSGLLINISRRGKTIAFNNGPRLISAPQVNHQDNSTVTWKLNDNFVLDSKNANGLDHFRWTVKPDGKLELDYSFSIEGQYDYYGISFDCPEEAFKSMSWLGQGPFRVWKNRMKGGWMNVWHREYNQAIAGQCWTGPEFGGYYKDVFWADVKLKTGKVGIKLFSPDVFLRVGKFYHGNSKSKAQVKNPDGGISFMHGISAIGTKFKKTSEMGPMSQLNQAKGQYKAKILFEF